MFSIKNALVASIPVVALGAILAGCATNPTSSVSTTADPALTTSSAPAPVKPAAPAQKKAGIGATYTISTTHLGGSPWHTIKIRLDKVTDPAKSSSDFMSPEPGNHYAATQFTWTVVKSDDSSGSNPSSIMEFTAKGTDGKFYNPAFTADSSQIENQHPSVGEPATGNVTFELPNGVHVVYVKYMPIGNGEYTWYVK